MQYPANYNLDFPKFKQAIEEGTIGEVPEGILADSLDKNLSDLIGNMLPSLLGGENLPDCDREANEVEIARIVYLSVVADVVSIRARQAEGSIAYRVVDEYGTA